MKTGTGHTDKNIFTGITLAVVATLIWSGNFIIARRVFGQIPPVSLAFFRWLTATIIMLPIGYRGVSREYAFIRKRWSYFIWAAFTGVTVFNTLVYIAGHSTTAINLSLIGTTSSPIMAIFLARVFLKERIGIYKVIGMILCITGILFLLSGGSWGRLMRFHFSRGDIWVLLAGFTFAVYSVLVRRKPAGVSPNSFLLVIFTLGTLLLLPFFLVEWFSSPPIKWDAWLLGDILFLGLGASVISFYCWNRAIAYLGAGRTSLFGNLIPIFSSLEAVFILGEIFTPIHAFSMVLVFAGLILANLKSVVRTR